jgi:hypothetical protein
MNKDFQAKRVKTWLYQNAEGRKVACVVRYNFPTPEGEKPKKEFRPISEHNDGWYAGGPPGLWPLYRLPDLEKADTIFVCEGEKCAEAVVALGLKATTSAHGSQSASKTDWSPLAGKDVYLLPDHDDAGWKYVKEVARILAKLDEKPSVKQVDLSFLGMKSGDDVVEWIEWYREKLNDHQIKEKLLELTKTAAEVPLNAPPDPDDEDDDDDDKKPNLGAAHQGGKKKSRATEIVDAARTKLVLWHTPEGIAYATTKEPPHQTWSLRRKPARQYLDRLYYEKTKVAAGNDAIQTAINTLEGIAVHDGEAHPVYTRLAEHEGRIYLDLGDDQWRAVAVGPSGWEVVSEYPVHFQRARGSLALPVPVTGGTVDELQHFINLANGDDFKLAVAWLLAAFRPQGPFPVLCLHGEQGAAKSTNERLLRSLIDPNKAPLRAEPKEPRDLIIAAENAAVIALDNLSRLPPWLSDCLCRLATGGGFGTRELFTDQDEIIFDAQRPVLLNGIEDLCTRGDLLDRAIIVTLDAIPEEKRKTEKELYQAFEKVKPGILGALLDVVSAGLKNLPRVKLDRLPRMADFATWATACEPSLGWEEGSFLRAYRSNVKDANELALGESVIVSPLRKLLEHQRGQEWQGTATELLDALKGVVDDKTAESKEWPKLPNALSNRLRRLAPNLRRTGISIEFRKIEHQRQVFLSLDKLGKTSSPSSPSSPNHGKPQKDPANGDDEGTIRGRSAKRGSSPQQPTKTWEK